MHPGKVALLTAIALMVFCPTAALAQSDTTPDTITIEKAQVLDAYDQHSVLIAGTETSELVQTLEAVVLDGPDQGRTVTFENDFTQLNIGDVFYIRHDVNQLEATDQWTVSDAYRLNVLFGLGAVFVLLLVLFGGVQGMRGLLSFGGSLILIFYLLLPGILSGYSPIFVSIGVASLIIVVGSYITHGFTKTTTAAVLGMIATVLVTGAGAYYVIHAAHLSGFTSEENVYLNFNASGTINMVGLLFGGIMIGLLGVLYDIAIGQAIAVEELFRAGQHLTPLEIYRRAIRIGREHIGALVNTLAIAYVGAALPLLLLVQQTSSANIWPTINGETFATEIIRILIGSIGLVLGVPITTALTVYILSRWPVKGAPTHAGHHH